MPGVKRRLALCLAVPLLGCASGGGHPVAEPAVRSAFRCEVEIFPEILPPAELLVDTARLSDDLRKMVEVAADFPGRQVVVTLAYQTDGINMRRDILTHDVQPIVADSIQKLVFARRLELPDSEKEWGVRLRIELGEDVSYGVERREYCPPRPRSLEMESAMSTYTGTGPRYRAGVRVRTVLMRATVHPTGHVVNGNVVRGDVTGSALEQRLLDYLRQFSFEPATIDGAPTYGHINIPIRIRD